MPITQAKCENCGGILQVDSNLKAANCPHCGVAYIIQDAINYYNNVNKINSLHAENVTVVDDTSAKARLDAANAYIKLEKYKDAYSEYNRVVDLTPQDYRGWWGLIVAGTHEFTRRIKSAKKLNLYNDFAESVKKLSTPEESSALIEQWTDYLSSEESRNQEEKDAIDLEMKKLDVQEQENIQHCDDLKNEYTAINALLISTGNRMSKPMTKTGMFFGIVLTLLALIYMLPQKTISNPKFVTFLGCLIFVIGTIIMISSYFSFCKYEKQIKGIQDLERINQSLSEAGKKAHVIIDNRNKLLDSLKEFE